MKLNLPNVNAQEERTCKCSHAAALFVHGIHNNLSRTDVECQWRKRKSSASLSSQAVSEMFPPPKKYTPLSRKPTDIDRAELYKDLTEYGRFTGLCWLLSPETTCFSRTFHSHNFSVFTPRQAIFKVFQLSHLVAYGKHLVSLVIYPKRKEEKMQMSFR